MSKPSVLALLLLATVTSLVSPPASCQAPLPPDPSSEIATDAERLVQKGVRFYDQGDFPAAITAYSKALALEPRNPYALYERALAYHAFEDYGRCLADAEAGTELDSPLDAGFFALGGSCLSSDGKPEKAIRFFRKGLEKHPDDIPLHLNIAVTLSNTGDLRRARSHLKAVLRQTPDHPAANLYLAFYYQQDGYRVPAVFQYLRFLAVEPSSERSATAASSCLEVLNLGLEKTGEHEFKLSVLAEQPTDEGDFHQLSLSLSLLSAAAKTEDYQRLRPAVRVAEILDRVVAITGEDVEAETKKTFVWSHAISFLEEMSRSGVLKPFSYLAFSSLKLGGADEWLAAHPEDVAKFHRWMRDRLEQPGT